MKKILVTGRSYIGKCFSNWVSQWKDKYAVDFLSLRKKNWKEYDFSKYDVLIHTAAIVHQKETPEKEQQYFLVNKDLTIEVAKKAKVSGIEQFIFISSISVYGLEGNVGKAVVITKDTPCHPKTLYGKSKLEAENELKKLCDDGFKISIVRTPMIYGPGCPGNYKRLQKLVLNFPVFPDIKNQRSMVFINNLSEFLKQLIDHQDSGLFFPQNKEYVNTVEMVRLIAQENSKKVYLIKLCEKIFKLLGLRINTINKVFGNLVVDLQLSNYQNFNYSVVDMEKSIEITENKKRVRCE